MRLAHLGQDRHVSVCVYVCVAVQSAMPTLAAAAPRLRSLNMSWLAMVNDWGLGQLSSLMDMQDLNLRATGGHHRQGSDAFRVQRGRTVMPSGGFIGAEQHACRALGGQFVCGQPRCGVRRLLPNHSDYLSILHVRIAYINLVFVITCISCTTHETCLEPLPPPLFPSGVQLESPLVLAALRCFSALTRLDLTRCRVTAAGIGTVAAAAPGLCVLSLAENAGLQSYTELQPLQQLSRLTRLDLSSPAPAMRLPQCQHSAVCQLTQLRHLALNCVIRTNRCAGWCGGVVIAVIASGSSRAASQNATGGGVSGASSQKLFPIG